MKQVFIYKDEDNQILIAKDGFKGVAVQVVRLVDQLRPNHENQLENFRTSHVVNQRVIPLDANFRANVKSAIEVAKEIVEDMKKSDQEIAGLMNDYYSSNREINEPGT